MVSYLILGFTCLAILAGLVIVGLIAIIILQNNTKGQKMTINAEITGLLSNPAKANTLSAVSLLLDSNRGVYIPQSFITTFDLSKWEGITIDNIAALSAGPDIEDYWSAWESVIDSATFTENGHVWRLYQDGDLWALCDELMTEEEKYNFEFDIND